MNACLQAIRYDAKHLVAFSELCSFLPFHASTFRGYGLKLLTILTAPSTGLLMRQGGAVVRRKGSEGEAQIRCL